MTSDDACSDLTKREGGRGRKAGPPYAQYRIIQNNGIFKINMKNRLDSVDCTSKYSLNVWLRKKQ